MITSDKIRVPVTGKQSPFRIARLFSRGVAVSAENEFSRNLAAEPTLRPSPPPGPSTIHRRHPRRHGRGLSSFARSRTFRFNAMAAAPRRPELDAAEGFRPKMSARGLAHLARRDGRNPIGPMSGFVEAHSPPFELQQAFGALFDALIVKHPGAGQIAAGSIDLFVGKCSDVHRADLFGDRADDALGLFGHRAGVNPEQSRQNVARVGHASADRIDKTKFVANDSPQAIAKPRTAAEDVVEYRESVEIGMRARHPEVA
jgi:hypothetical protein